MQHIHLFISIHKMNNLQFEVDKYPQDKPQVGQIKKIVNWYKKLIACDCHNCDSRCGLLISQEDKKEDDKEA